MLKNVLSMVLFVFIYSCNEPPHAQVDYQKEYHIDIGNRFEAAPLDFDKSIIDIRYIFLERGSSRIDHVDKLVVSNKQIYIHDRGCNIVFVYTMTGSLVCILKNANAFDLYKNKIYTYQLNGLLKVYSSEGTLIKKKSIGFRGVEFANLNDSLLVFSTAGLVTRDNGSTKFELSFVNRNGHLRSFGLPIRSVKQGVNYTAFNRFTRFGKELYFTPSLERKVFKIHDDKISSVFAFDFGKYTLTDNAFEKIKKIEDYNYFPYIINLTNLFIKENNYFFTYSLKGKEGYILFNNKMKQIDHSALSAVAGVNSEYNNTIPVACANSELISVISKNEFMENFNLMKSNNVNWRNSKMKNINKKFLIKNHNPILMFYKLKEN